MLFKSTFLTLGAFVTAALAQTSESCDSASGICFQQYYDQDLGITLGVAAPETDSDEFIMQIMAPPTFGYTGVTLGESMMNNLMLVVWPNGNDVMISPRMASDYANSPATYAGDVTITMLPDSMINSTIIKATFRCQGCTTWTGGSLDMDSSSFTFGYATNTVVKVNPIDSTSGSLFVHNQQDFATMDLAASKTSSYSSFVKRSLIRG